MSAADFWGFALVAATLVASPGPDSLLILRNAIGRGRAAGFLTLCGVQVGIAAHTLLAALGLSALLYAADEWFRLLALVGSLYLAWIGLQTIIRPDPIGGRIEGGRIEGRRDFFRQGLLCNLLNPKVVLIFVALMPNFLDTEKNAAPQLVTMGAVLLAINIPFQAALATAAEALARRLERPATRFAVRFGLGGALFALAAGLFLRHVWSPR